MLLIVFCMRVHLPRFCQPLVHVIICRVKSGQTAVQICERACVDDVRYCLMMADVGHLII